MNEKIKILLKGLAIGTCNVIPGISGGTIAFITGIYTRLMDGITSYTPATFFRILRYKNKKDAREAVTSLDIPFFIPLILGVAAAVYAASYYIPYLLATYFVFTMSFLIGLIIASAFYIFSQITKATSFSRIMGLVGFLFGISLAYIIPLDMKPTYVVLFLSGVIAMFATLLPGVSGAYVLLILGQYEFIIGSLRILAERFWHLLVFAIGALFGTLTISRIISYALHRWKSTTLYLLSGIVLGALNTPIRRIIENGFIWSGMNIVYVILLFCLGIGVVLGLQKLAGDGKIV